MATRNIFGKYVEKKFILTELTLMAIINNIIKIFFLWYTPYSQLRFRTIIGINYGNYLSLFDNDPELRSLRGGGLAPN